MKQVDAFLMQAVDMGASDLHLPAGSPALIRRHGQLRRFEMDALSREMTTTLLREVLTEQQWRQFETELELDFAYEIPGISRFRANAFTHRLGVSLCFRAVRSPIPSFDELGVPEEMRRQLDHRQGLILITGGAGSGKSTTLAAMVDHINATRAHHVLTVEDPIESVHPVKKGAVNQRELGRHTQSFSNALKAALRENPDVIVVGDMRDAETISLSISASEAGHLVIASMNTSSAPKTIDKIIDSCPATQQKQIRAMLGETLKAIFTQRLVPRADGNGLALAYELLLGSMQLATLIKDAKTHQIPNIITTGRARGMRQLDDTLQELLQAGTITEETALRNATNTKRFGGAASDAAGAASAGASEAGSGRPKPGVSRRPPPRR